MQGKPASLILLFLLVVGTIVLAHNVQPVKASGTIYINADGSINPPTAPISTSDNVTYIFTDNINGSIVIGRSDTVIDGNGYTLQGTGVETGGIDLSETVNVTVQHAQIQGFSWGIFDIPPCPCYGSRISDNTISRNNITSNTCGIAFQSSAGNRISENNIANNYIGIELDEETYIIENPYMTPVIYDDSIFGNIIANNHFGIILFLTEYCRIYHNNFMGNYQQAGIYGEDSVTWDLGYPQGGNYWSDCTGVDVKSGPNQDQPGSDGIGDTPYIIDSNNADHYPIMPHDVAVTSVTADRAGVCQGLPVYVNFTVLNKGNFDENVTVTLYYNITANQIIGARNVTLSPGQNETVDFVWDTTGVPYCQNYTLTAVATIPLDNIPADNTQACGPITVRIMGDTNGDGKVDGKDVALVGLSFGSCGPDYMYLGSPPYPRWNLDCDTNGDNKIDGKDIVLTALNFGKAYP